MSTKDIIKIDLDKHLESMDFINTFLGNVRLLFERYERYKKIPVYDFSDRLTYFDMLIVQLRAMCIENNNYTTNYTVQIMMIKLGKADLAERLDNFLNKTFMEEHFIEGRTIRNVIKFIADKFICHYDNTTKAERSEETIYRTFLGNPAMDTNLETILKEITEILTEGFNIYLSNS